MIKEERIALNQRRFDAFDRYRVAKGVTLYHISKELGIPNTTLYEWRKGLSCPKGDYLVKLCDYVGMQVSEVFANG